MCGGEVEYTQMGWETLRAMGAHEGAPPSRKKCDFLNKKDKNMKTKEKQVLSTLACQDYPPIDAVRLSLCSERKTETAMRESLPLSYAQPRQGR